MLTKQEEMARFMAFVSDQPTDSYLYGILAGDVERMVMDAIRTDMGFIDLHGLWTERVETEKKLEELRKLHAQLVKDQKAEIARLGRDAEHLYRILDKLDGLADEASRDAAHRKRVLKEVKAA